MSSPVFSCFSCYPLFSSWRMFYFIMEDKLNREDILLLSGGYFISYVIPIVPHAIPLVSSDFQCPPCSLTIFPCFYYGGYFISVRDSLYIKLILYGGYSYFSWSINFIFYVILLFLMLFPWSFLFSHVILPVSNCSP